jgi:hypothetical protein
VSNSILIFLLILIGVLLLAWVLWPRHVHRITGKASELEPRIAQLMQSERQTFLIVRVAGTRDFLQLTAAPDSAQIDFPLVTDRQRELEPKIREAAAELQLDFRETCGSDGTRFLDCDLTATPAEIARACRQLLQRVFGITEDATLAYETNANI